MSKAVSRIRRSKKLRATLQKNGGMRIAISRSLKNITAQLIAVSYTQLTLPTTLNE